MKALLRYTAPVFVLLLGLALLVFGMSADRAVLARADFDALAGRLPVDADLGGPFHSFALDNLPGSQFSIQTRYLDVDARRDFASRMRAGAQVQVAVPTTELRRLVAEGRAHLHVHSLAADGVPLLDLDTCLADQAAQARSEGHLYLVIGVVLVLAGLLLGYARRHAPISRYR
jgi:hypothetical protein